MAKFFDQLEYEFRYKDRTIEGVMKINLDRFEGQYGRAQWELDNMIMTAMVPYMPMQTGTFINVTRGMSSAIAGSGTVVAAAPPMWRYLYEGVKMVDSATGKGPAVITTKSGEKIPRFRKGAKLKPTTEPLNYSRHAHPEVTDHWFDAAKNEHGEAWVKKTKELAGGG